MLSLMKILSGLLESIAAFFFGGAVNEMDIHLLMAAKRRWEEEQGVPGNEEEDWD